MGFFGRGKSSKRNTAAPPPGPPPPPARCGCGNFATSGKEDGLCNACRSAKAKFSAPTPVETAAAVRVQAVKRGQLSRRESTVRLLSVIADEDAQIAAAIGGVLTAANYAEVILKVHEFKRKLLAMRVIQRRARASIDARAQTPRSEQPPVVSRPAYDRTASELPSREAAIMQGIKLLDQRILVTGLQQEIMKDDGNCQFRALSYQLYGTQDRHAAVRAATVAHMRRLREEYGVFFIDDEFDAFLTNMAREKTWGDELTIRAAADAFGCTVHVITSDADNWHLRYTPAGMARQPSLATADLADGSGAGRRLFLTYISPVHYNCIRRTTAPLLAVAPPPAF